MRGAIMSSAGIVYILTNPCLDGWVKIGMTQKNDITQRLKELNQPTNLPLSYRCYATYEVDDALLVEQSVHRIIDQVDNTLHARETLGNGKIREREFFRFSPETAFRILQEVAILRKEVDCLKLYAPTDLESTEEEIAVEKSKRGNNSFKLLGITEGEKITFLLDEAIEAEVLNAGNKVKYEGSEYSVSGLAKKILVERHGWHETVGVNGWRQFTKDGVTLSELRDRIEQEQIRRNSHLL